LNLMCVGVLSWSLDVFCLTS